MYRLVAHSDIEHYSEKSNVVLAKTMANVLWPEINGLVRSLKNHSRGDSDWLGVVQVVLDEPISDLIRETNVLAVELHTIDGYTVFSTIKGHSGIEDPHKNFLVKKALAGQIITDIQFHEVFSLRDGRQVLGRYILSSYLPVKNRNNGEVEAVFEVFSDVSGQYAKVVDSQLKFAGVLTVVFLSIYIIVYFLIRYLDAVIRNNIDLTVAMDSEKNANVAKTQFLATMSHELRTPLNAIIGYSEMLEEDFEFDGHTSASQDLGKIQVAARHLLHLINEILDLSKIEAGQMGLYSEAVNVVELVQEIMQVIKPLVAEKGNQIVLNCAADITVYTDALKLRQILINLLSNASKFTENGCLELGLNTHNGDLVVSVKDNGIGMTPEQVSHLFQPFVQADESTTRRYGGTGLGLTISKHYCEMMGGVISVQSMPGRGSVFTVNIPIVDGFNREGLAIGTEAVKVKRSVA